MRVRYARGIGRGLGAMIACKPCKDLGCAPGACANVIGCTACKKGQALTACDLRYGHCDTTPYLTPDWALGTHAQVCVRAREGGALGGCHAPRARPAQPALRAPCPLHPPSASAQCSPCADAECDGSLTCARGDQVCRSCKRPGYYVLGEANLGASVGRMRQCGVA